MEIQGRKRPVLPQHARAVRFLALATLFWGLSFPIMNSIGELQQQLLPHASTWFGTSVVVFARFFILSLIIGVISARTLSKMTRLEIWHSTGLGFFGGIGLLFHMDGL